MKDVIGNLNKFKEWSRRFREDDPESACAEHLPEIVRTLIVPEGMKILHNAFKSGIDAYPEDIPAKRLLARVAEECPPDSSVSYIIAAGSLRSKGQPVTMTSTRLLFNRDNNPVFADFCGDLAQEQRDNHVVQRNEPYMKQISRRRMLKAGVMAGAYALTALPAVFGSWLQKEGGEVVFDYAKLIRTLGFGTGTAAAALSYGKEEANLMAAHAIQSLSPLVALEMNKTSHSPHPPSDEPLSL